MARRIAALRVLPYVKWPAERIGNPKPEDPEVHARVRALRIRQQVERRIGKPLEWRDEGNVALSIQYHQNAPTRFRHRIDPSDCTGFYFPCDFAEECRHERETIRRIEKLRRESPYPPPKEEPPPKVPRGKSLHGWGKVGSPIRLLRELDKLNQVLKLSGDFGQLRDGNQSAPKDDPLEAVKYAWGVLHYAARVSSERRLPLMLDG